jgi:hypothetical protein
LEYNTAEYKYRCIANLFSNSVRIVDEKVTSFVNVYFETNLLTLNELWPTFNPC